MYESMEAYAEGNWYKRQGSSIFQSKIAKMLSD